MTQFCGIYRIVKKNDHGQYFFFSDLCEEELPHSPHFKGKINMVLRSNSEKFCVMPHTQ